VPGNVVRCGGWCPKKPIFWDSFQQLHRRATHLFCQLNEVRHWNLRLWFEREESDDSLQIASQVLSVDRPRGQYLNLPVDHGPVSREVGVMSAQVEVVADVVKGLAQLNLV
jgi:hypothetical protein